MMGTSSLQSRVALLSDMDANRLLQRAIIERPRAEVVRATARLVLRSLRAVDAPNSLLATVKFIIAVSGDLPDEHALLPMVIPWRYQDNPFLKQAALATEFLWTGAFTGYPPGRAVLASAIRQSSVAEALAEWKLLAPEAFEHYLSDKEVRRAFHRHAVYSRAVADGWGALARALDRIPPITGIRLE